MTASPHRRALLLLLFLPVTLTASTFRVGPARTYTTLQQVAALLIPGDTVLVDGDTTYPGGVTFSRPGAASDRILIRGVRINGRRPVIAGGTNAVAFTTGSPNADHYTFEGFEIRNATFRGIYHQAGDLIVRDVVVHHCNNGLMGADNGSGSLLLEYSEFYANGSGTSAHQIYMATDEVAHPGSVFRMQFCFIHDGAGGNNVKSRAERNEITYNWIEGAYYHELELIGPDPAGGVPAGLKREDSDVVGNVLWKRATSFGGSGTFYVMRLGGDGTGESNGRYRVVNNTILMGTSAAFRLFDGLESVEMHNNAFSNNGTAAAPVVRTAEAVWTSGEQISGSNNWVEAQLTTLPAGWTATLRGSSPGFQDFAGGDPRPASGSPLVNAGSTPVTPAGFPFPSPLFPPASHPPLRSAIAPGSDAPRTLDAAYDIGAFERSPAVGIGADQIPPSIQLEQNFPNPFNPRTRIELRIQHSEFLSLRVYDPLGREVAVLMDEAKEPGKYSIEFDGTGLASGVYVYRMTSGSFTRTRKMILVR